MTLRTSTLAGSLLCLTTPTLLVGEEALPSPVTPFLDQHCLECHDDISTEGGLNLLDLAYDPGDPVNLAKWARVHDQVASGAMPPEKKPRPDESARTKFTGALTDTLNQAWQERYATSGRTGGRRLNPTEYEYTLHDLLAAPYLELRPMLPPDPEVHGFDNVAEAQEISYVQLSRYLEAAEVAIDGAMRLGPKVKPVTVRTWFSEEPRYLGKDWKERQKAGEKRPEWVPFLGQPNSAQAPRRIRNTSPKIAGWYRFRVRCRSFFYDKKTGEMTPPKEGHVAWINTAAKRTLGKFDVPGNPDGGIVEFSAWQNQDELLEFFCATLDDRTIRQDDYQGDGIAVDWIEIEGPFANERCLSFALEAIVEKACFQDAMRQAYKAALCSPDFLLFREDPGRLAGEAIASRLSYLFWRSLPDADLRKAAEEGTLLTDEGLRTEFARLLADPKSERFFSDFAGQWLELRNVHETSPDRYLFPEYFCDNHLVDSGVAETVATFAAMVKENLPARTVIGADFVLVNERLAELYDIEGVSGLELQRVSLSPDSPRGGLLTQSSILKVTANGLTTSPVIRGVWVLERILGKHLTAPPPDAGAIEPDTQGASTIRELLALHSRSESCASCHVSIDPPGFALENFDVMGAWRDNYRSFGEGEALKLKVAHRPVRYKRGLPVDPSGITVDGQPFADIFEFREHLLEDERQIARNLVERFLTFATGAEITFADRVEIESILDATEAHQYPVRDLLERVVLSQTFRSK